jgi:hypothetical protein
MTDNVPDLLRNRRRVPGEGKPADDRRGCVETTLAALQLGLSYKPVPMITRSYCLAIHASLPDSRSREPT